MSYLSRAGLSGVRPDGDDVLVGHMAMIHGTRIEDRGFVGFSAQTMNGCVIEADGMLAAGALRVWSGVLEPEQIADVVAFLESLTDERQLGDAPLSGLSRKTQDKGVDGTNLPVIIVLSFLGVTLVSLGIALLIKWRIVLMLLI